MRDIKFRIVYKNKIVGYENLTDSGWKWMWIDLNPDKGERWHKGVIEDSTWRAMERNQFTGLHDKNGNEIYEGDLVAEIDRIEDLKGFGKPLSVEFGEFSSEADSWGIKDHTVGFFLRYHDSGENAITGLHSQENGYGFNCKSIIVIGNIYSNPELL
jgi:uncharacterized phage protein (TIGR01671 family)